MPAGDLNDYYFGPLSRKYCVWFYWLSVIGFVMLILLLISATIFLFTNKRGMNTSLVYSIIQSALFYLVVYFQNRLLYTMCVK